MKVLVEHYLCDWVTDSPTIILSREHYPVTVVPTVILTEIYKVMVGENGQPGLEDYLTKKMGIKPRPRRTAFY